MIYIQNALMYTWEESRPIVPQATSDEQPDTDFVELPYEATVLLDEALERAPRSVTDPTPTSLTTYTKTCSSGFLPSLIPRRVTGQIFCVSSGPMGDLSPSSQGGGIGTGSNESQAFATFIERSSGDDCLATATVA